MKGNRALYIILLSKSLIVFLLATEDKFIWDFGVVISSTMLSEEVDRNISKKMHNALIADPFVAPISSSLLNNKATIPFNESLYNLSLSKNICNIKLMAAHLTIQHDYQAVIGMINQVDFTNLTEKDYLDLNYWFANAYLETGEYQLAENIIVESLEFNLNDRFYFLLAMTYEANNKKMAAKKKYASFIDLFPQSEYIGSAKIKARILGRR